MNKLNPHFRVYNYAYTWKEKIIRNSIDIIDEPKSNINKEMNPCVRSNKQHYLTNLAQKISLRKHKSMKHHIRK